MTNRPTRNNRAGCTGCFLVIFFAFFAWFGMMSLGQYISGSGGRHTMGNLPPLVFGAIFSLVGLAGIGGGIYSLTIGNQRHNPLKLKLAPPSYNHNPWFPKLSTRKDMGKIQLRPEVSTGCSFWFLLVFALIWNGITYAAIFGIVRDEKFSVFPLVFMSVFAVIGALVLWAWVRVLLQILLVGRTVVEIGSEPVPVGGATTLLLRQNGNFTADKVRISLICREEASYGAGSSRTTDKHEVYAKAVLERSNVPARGYSPMVQTEFAIPPDAMHSFKSGNNVIAWGVRIEMVIPGRPDVDMFFPFRVSPVVTADRYRRSQ